MEQEWSGKRDSNPQPSAWKADALAVELFPHTGAGVLRRAVVSRQPRCLLQPRLLPPGGEEGGGGGWIRTTEVLRRQIYSLFPLATRETSLNITQYGIEWSWWTDLNPRPTDYKSVALPTELHQRIWYILCVSSEKYQTYLKIYFVLCSQTQDDTQEDERILEDEECARRIQKTPAASNQTDERSRWKEGSSRKPRWQLEAGRERQECESRVNRASSRTGCSETEEAIPGPAPTSPPSESLRSPCRIDNHYYSSEVTFLQFQAIKKPIRV